MEIKCIALDLDGTTLDRRGHLSPENRGALEYAVEKGVHVVVASGRSFTALPQDVLAVPGIEYAITSNGAAVYHIPTGQRLHGYTLSPASVTAILEATVEENLAYETFIAGRPYAAADYVAQPELYGATEKGITYVKRTRTPVEDIAAFIRSHDTELDCIDLVLPDHRKKPRLVELLCREVPEVYITSSIPHLIEISHRDAGKHSGLRFITELLGLDPAQTAAFGDADNDVDMLRYVGCGVAVANATPVCLAAADHVTLHHAENGLAHAIYHILKL